MIRRSFILLSKASPPSTLGRKGRTVVRDPRKAAKKGSARSGAVVARQSGAKENPNHLPAEPQSSLPFQPSQQNQQSVGSSLVSYGLAGVGVAMGMTLVRALLGGF